ncbi:ABC transporter substrate-binding protein [Planctomycetota bacterium]
MKFTTDASRVLICVTVLLLVGFCGCGREKPQSQYLTICSYGGAFQDAQRAAYFEPFTKATGIEIREASYGGEYAKIKLMVESGNIEWDLVDIESDMLLRGAKAGLYEPIDYAVVDKNDLVGEGAHRYGVASDLFSSALAYSTDAFPKGKEPKDWADFWDTERFPGPRSLRRDPRSTLEFALLADGVEPEKLYPLDVDRAFASLDRIRPSITVWWTSGHQPSELLASGEVVLASSFSARIWVASIKDEKPMAFTFNQALIDPEWWITPRGCEKKALAMQFIAFASRAENQANFPEHIGLGPSNPKALELIEPALARQLNTHPDNFTQQIFVDAAWWAENYASVQKRWLAWIVGSNASVPKE